MSALESKIGAYEKALGHKPFLLEPVAQGIFGGTLEPYLDAAIEDPTASQIPMEDLLKILHTTQDRYFQYFPIFRASKDFREHLSVIQSSIRTDGDVQLLSEDIETAQEFGAYQTGFASKILVQPGHEHVAPWLAKNGYGQIGESVMPSGIAILGKNLKELNEDSHELPLSFSNTVLANILFQLLLKRKPRQQTHIIDLGSGRGMALAHAILAATEAFGKSGKPRFTGIEICDPLHESLIQDFAPQTLLKIQALYDAGTVTVNTDIRKIGDTRRAFSLLHGDILDLIPTVLRSSERDDEIDIIMSSYTLMRLPSTDQNDLFRDISKFSDNSIILIADLKENASDFNRKAANLCGPLGPLNCGNRFLEYNLAQNGFRVVPVNGANAANFVGAENKHLITGIEKHNKDDGMLLVAYRGSQAAAMVEGHR